MAWERYSWVEVWISWRGIMPIEEAGIIIDLIELRGGDLLKLLDEHQDRVAPHLHPVEV